MIKIKKIPFIISCCPFFIASCASPKIHDNLSDLTNEPELGIITSDQFFPKININSYWEYINFDEHHNPYITDKLRLEFVKSIIKRVASSKGEIAFYEEFIDKRHINFYFKWEYNNKVLYKIYKLEI